MAGQFLVSKPASNWFLVRQQGKKRVQYVMERLQKKLAAARRYMLLAAAVVAPFCEAKGWFIVKCVMRAARPSPRARILVGGGCEDGYGGNGG